MSKLLVTDDVTKDEDYSVTGHPESTFIKACFALQNVPYKNITLSYSSDHESRELSVDAKKAILDNLLQNFKIQTVKENIFDKEHKATLREHLIKNKQNSYKYSFLAKIGFFFAAPVLSLAAFIVDSMKALTAVIGLFSFAAYRFGVERTKDINLALQTYDSPEMIANLAGNELDAIMQGIKAKSYTGYFKSFAHTPSWKKPLPFLAGMHTENNEVIEKVKAKFH